MPLEMGRATCSHCGATVGTLFSESNPTPVVQSKYRDKRYPEMSTEMQLEKAQERANTALVLALASFFCPGLGFFASVASILLAGAAARTLRRNNVEEGQGMATAAIVTGVIAVIAQACMVLYFIKMGLPV
jgi:hypothetical protein